MLAWMAYVVLVSLLLGLAALVFERAARLRKGHTRWLWGASILASLLLPFMISSVSVQIPKMTSVIGPDVSARTVVLRQMTARELSPSEWLTAGTGELIVSSRLDGLLEGGWFAASALLLLVVVGSSLHLSWRRRRWARDTVAGVPVLIAEDVGPAIVGLIAPQIVVPRWLVTATASEQELVIAHEDAHLEAHDAQLLAVALLLLVGMPWNLPLWWQLQRLRVAIEIDCDARVLRRGHDPRRYGEALIAVGERQSTDFAVVAAMSESTSLLEYRIRHMFRKQSKWAGAATIALVGLGCMLAAVAAEVSPPNVDDAAKPGRREVALDPTILDRYVGFYQLSDNAVLSVTRVGHHLLTQSTGQRAVPVYAKDKTEFFAKVADAQITFIVGDSGDATSLISHQGTRNVPMPRIDTAAAHQIAARLDEKVRSQAASQGTEAALRRLVSGIVDGTPVYDDMSPSLAEAIRNVLPKLQADLGRWGAIKSVKFLGVGPHGEDVYTVWQDNGASHWQIALDLKGTITTAIVTPGP